MVPCVPRTYISSTLQQVYFRLHRSLLQISASDAHSAKKTRAEPAARPSGFGVCCSGFRSSQFGVQFSVRAFTARSATTSNRELLNRELNVEPRTPKPEPTNNTATRLEPKHQLNLPVRAEADRRATVCDALPNACRPLPAVNGTPGCMRLASVVALLGSALGSVPADAAKFVVLKMLKISSRSSPFGPRTCRSAWQITTIRPA